MPGPLSCRTFVDRMRAVLVLIDGARVDVLRELLGRGDLPNLSRWVIERGGLTTGTTVFPSTTGVAYIPFLFGRYPGSVGIPAFAGSIVVAPRAVGARSGTPPGVTAVFRA